MTPFLFCPFHSFVSELSWSPCPSHPVTFRTVFAQWGRSWRGEGAGFMGQWGCYSPWTRLQSAPPHGSSWQASPSSTCPSCWCCVPSTFTWRHTSEPSPSPTCPTRYHTDTTYKNDFISLKSNYINTAQHLKHKSFRHEETQANTQPSSVCHIFIFPPVFCCAGSRWSKHPPAPTGGSQGLVRPGGMYIPSSMSLSLVCHWVSLQFLMQHQSG